MGKKKKQQKTARNFGFAIVLFVALTCLAYWLFIESRSEIDEGRAKKNISMATEPIEDSVKFEKMLEEGNVSRLQRHAEARRKNKNEIVLLEMENIQKQIQIADRILEKSENKEQELFARNTKLNALLEREMVLIQHDMHDPESTEELHEYAVLCSMLGFEGAAGKSIAAKNLVRISQFIFDNDIDSRAKKRADALQHFSVEITNRNDFHLAEQMSRMVKLIQESGIKTEADPFLRKFMEQFDSSTNREIMSIVDSMKPGIGRTDFAVVDIINADPTQRDEKIQQVLVQAEAVSKQNTSDVDEESVYGLLDNARDLIRLGLADKAKLVRSKIAQFSNRSPELVKKFSIIDTGLVLLDTPFNASGLENRKGRQVDLTVKPSQFKVLLFLSNDSLKESNVAFRQIRTSINKQFREVVRLTMVLVDDGSDAQARNKMVRVAYQEKVGFLIVDLESDDGKEISKRLPIMSTPFTIVLKNDRTLIAIDPPPQLVDEVILRNKS